MSNSSSSLTDAMTVPSLNLNVFIGIIVLSPSFALVTSPIIDACQDFFLNRAVSEGLDMRQTVEFVSGVGALELSVTRVALKQLTIQIRVNATQLDAG